MRPLSLSSERWQSLTSHFGNAGSDTDELPSVPKLIRRWSRTVGSYAEEYEAEPLRESCLHQDTVVDVAYAALPHLVARIEQLDPDRRDELLDDVALVEQVRRTPRSAVEATLKAIEADRTLPPEFRALQLRATRERNPELPDDLADAYLAAEERARQLAGKDWGRERSRGMGPHRWRRHVRYLRTHGLSDDDITRAFRELVRLDEHGANGTMSWDAGPRLRALASTDAGLAARLRLKTAAGELAVIAVQQLAQLDYHVTIVTMLRSE